MGGSPVVFPVGAGASDLIPHQMLRAGNDRLYLFTSQLDAAGFGSSVLLASGILAVTGD